MLTIQDEGGSQIKTFEAEVSLHLFESGIGLVASIGFIMKKLWLFSLDLLDSVIGSGINSIDSACLVFEENYSEGRFALEAGMVFDGIVNPDSAIGAGVLIFGSIGVGESAEGFVGGVFRQFLEREIGDDSYLVKTVFFDGVEGFLNSFGGKGKIGDRRSVYAVLGIEGDPVRLDGFKIKRYPLFGRRGFGERRFGEGWGFDLTEKRRYFLWGELPGFG